MEDTIRTQWHPPSWEEIPGLDDFYRESKIKPEIKSITGPPRQTDFSNDINSLVNGNTNDKYVSLDKALSFAKMLGGKVIKYDNAGHFSSNDGYQEFRDILKYL